MSSYVAPPSPQELLTIQYRNPYKPTDLIRDPETIESLCSHMQDVGENLNFEDHVVLHHDRSKPPRTINRFRFYPLVPAFSPNHTGTFRRHIKAVEYPSWLQTHYRATGARPYLDAVFGLGFVYDNTVTAVCVGGLAVEGLLINQIQAVAKNGSQSGEPASLNYRDGLRSGIDWVQTLVSGWRQMTQTALKAYGIDPVPPTWIQAAANNYWLHSPDKLDTARYRRMHDRYDRTALQLGGVQDEVTKNYKLPEVSSK